jgi:hypothetical protein
MIPACMLCAGQHLMKNHLCNVVGCNADAGQTCIHNVDKYVNCNEGISKKPNFRLKHPGVLNVSDGSEGAWYPLPENFTVPVAQATGRVP